MKGFCRNKWIEPNYLLGQRFKENGVLYTVLRDGIGDRTGQVTVRIDEGEPSAIGNVLLHHVPEECRLAGARRADDVDVLPTFSGGKVDGACKVSHTQTAEPCAEPCPWSSVGVGGSAVSV